MKTQFVVCDTTDDVTTKASKLIQTLCAQAISEYGQASLAVSGGSTPQALFKVWQAETFPNLSCVNVFMSDERMVPTESQDSNHGTMLRLWPDVRHAKLHLPNTSAADDAAAIDYERQVVETIGEMSEFDCIMLGLGEDGHTASLFPGKPSLNDQHLVCSADFGELPPPVKRLTFTYKCINRARNVVVIATGSKKKVWISALLNGDINKTDFPLSGVQPAGNLWVILDRTAWPEA